MKPRSDGKPLVWQKHCIKKREDLGVPTDLRPWSGRPEIKLHGVARQLSTPNFVGELLDLHLMLDNQRFGKELADDPREDLMADIGQDLRYQTQAGPACLLSNSRIYFYVRDRTGAPEENLRMNGWGDDIDMDAVENDTIMDMRRLAGLPVKRRKGKPVAKSTKLRDLAGNGECLPDLASIAIPLVFCLNTDYFAHRLAMCEIPLDDIYSGTLGDKEKKISIPLNATQTDLRALDRALRGEAVDNLDLDDLGLEDLQELSD